jgi:hypothetical protein
MAPQRECGLFLLSPMADANARCTPTGLLRLHRAASTRQPNRDDDSEAPSNDEAPPKIPLLAEERKRRTALPSLFLQADRAGLQSPGGNRGLRQVPS